MTGTLTVWMTILLLGAVFMAIFGYHNVHIPKDQKEKAEKARRNPELEVSESEYEAPKVITYEIRVDRVWYVVLTTVISTVTIISFVVEEFHMLAAMVGDGIVGTVFAVIVVLVALVVFEVVLLYIVANAECSAIREMKKHYFRHYGVFVVAVNEEF